METYNFKQIVNSLPFKTVLNGDFICISQYQNFHFAFFMSNVSSSCKCLFLNYNRLISSAELLELISLTNFIDDIIFTETKDFDFSQYIADKQVLPYCKNLIPLNSIEKANTIDLDSLSNSREFISFISLFPNVFLPQHFFFYGIGNKFSLKLPSVNSKYFDLLDFSDSSSSLRYELPDCLWASPSFNQTLEVLIARNPFSFHSHLATIDSPDNLAFKYRFIIPGNLSKNTIHKTFSDLPDNKTIPYAFLSTSLDDSLFFLKLLCDYISLFKSKTVSLHLSPSNFTIDFVHGLMEAPNKTLQFFANIQSSYSKNYSGFISDTFPLYTNNFKTGHFQILSINLPITLELLNSCFQELCAQYYINFKVISFPAQPQ